MCCCLFLLDPFLCHVMLMLAPAIAVNNIYSTLLPSALIYRNVFLRVALGVWSGFAIIKPLKPLGNYSSILCRFEDKAKQNNI